MHDYSRLLKADKKHNKANEKSKLEIIQKLQQKYMQKKSKNYKENICRNKIVYQNAHQYFQEK